VFPGGLTTGAVAKILDLSPTRVRQLADAGRLAYTDTPLGRLYDPAGVEKLRQERAGAAGAA